MSTWEDAHPISSVLKGRDEIECRQLGWAGPTLNLQTSLQGAPLKLCLGGDAQLPQNPSPSMPAPTSAGQRTGARSPSKDASQNGKCLSLSLVLPWFSCRL